MSNEFHVAIVGMFPNTSNIQRVHEDMTPANKPPQEPASQV
jgi:hypothetical protein